MNSSTISEHHETPGWLWGAVIILVAAAPGQLAYAIDPKHGPFIAYADLLAAVIIAVWGVWVLMTRRLGQLFWPPRQTWALLAIAILSGLSAESLKLALLEIIQLGLYFILAYMLFADVLRSERRQQAVCLVLLAATSVAVGHALFQYAVVTDASGVKAAFQSRSAYSAYLVMVLPLAYALTLRSTRLWERLWGGALLVLGGLTILSPGLIFILVLVLMAITIIGGSRGHLLIYVPAAVVFCLVTMTWAPLNRAVWQETCNPYEESDVYKLMDSGATDIDLNQVYVKKRWIEWMPALNMMAENYLLGVGTGNYQINIGRPEYYGFLPNVKKSEADTNNLFLVTGSSMGFAGLVALLGFMGTFIQRAMNLWRQIESQKQRVWAAGLYGLALAIPLVSIFSSLFVRGTALVWALGYALIMVMLSAVPTDTAKECK